MEPDSMVSTPLPAPDAEMEVEVIDYLEEAGDEDVMLPETDAEMVEQTELDVEAVEPFFEGDALASGPGMEEETEMAEAAPGWSADGAEGTASGDRNEGTATEDALAVPSEQLDIDLTVEDEPVAPLDVEVSGTGDEPVLETDDANVASPAPEAEAPVLELDDLVDPLVAPEQTDSEAQVAVPSSSTPSAVPTQDLPATHNDVASPVLRDAKGKGRAMLAHVDDSPLCTCSADALIRPTLRLSLLNAVPYALPATASTSSLVAPPILLNCNNVRYSLFQPYTDDLEHEQERALLFPEERDQELYFGSMESFLQAIHTLFPDFARDGHELVMSFPELGISLAEDNVYTRETSLSDFDRLHAGCRLPGILSVSLESQNRFASDFNALLRHVASQNQLDDTSADVIEGTTTDADQGAAEQEPFDEGAPDAEPAREEPYAATDDCAQEGEPLYDEGVYEGEDDETAWASEVLDLETLEDGEGTFDQEAFDLEEALADLDSDDLSAVVDGAIEDLEEGDEPAPVAFEEGDVEVVLENSEGVVLEEIATGGDAELGGEEIAAEDAVVTVEEVELPTDKPTSTIDTPPSVPVLPLPSTLQTSTGALSYNFSYDSPAGTGLEPPSIPPQGGDAIVDAASANAMHVAANGKGDGEGSEPSVVAAVDELVIDYDEVFDATSLARSPTSLAVPDTKPAVDVAPTSGENGVKSPKRSRDEVLELPAHDEAVNGEAKRPKLVPQEIAS